MKLLADEGVDAQIVLRLRADGHQVEDIAELDPGVDDDTVLQRANNVGALLVTADKDFGDLVFRQDRVHAGVILLRLAGLTHDLKATIVTAALRDHAAELHGAFSVISPGAIRIRQRPDPGRE